MENEKAGGYVSVSYVGTKEDQVEAKKEVPVEKKESNSKVVSKDEK